MNCANLLGNLTIFHFSNTVIGPEQVVIANDDRGNGCSRKRAGYKLTKQPFLLWDDLYSVSQTMDILLLGGISTPVLQYLHYTIMFSQTPDIHIEQLLEVLGFLNNEEVKMRLSTCRLFIKVTITFATSYILDSSKSLSEQLTPYMYLNIL